MVASTTTVPAVSADSFMVMVRRQFHELVAVCRDNTVRTHTLLQRHTRERPKETEVSGFRDGQVETKKLLAMTHDVQLQQLEIYYMEAQKKLKEFQRRELLNEGCAPE